MTLKIPDIYDSEYETMDKLLKITLGILITSNKKETIDAGIWSLLFVVYQQYFTGYWKSYQS